MIVAKVFAAPLKSDSDKKPETSVSPASTDGTKRTRQERNDNNNHRNMIKNKTAGRYHYRPLLKEPELKKTNSEKKRYLYDS